MSCQAIIIPKMTFDDKGLALTGGRNCIGWHGDPGWILYEIHSFISFGRFTKWSVSPSHVTSHTAIRLSSSVHYYCLWFVRHPPPWPLIVMLRKISERWYTQRYCQDRERNDEVAFLFFFPLPLSCTHRGSLCYFLLFFCDRWQPFLWHYALPMWNWTKRAFKILKELCSSSWPKIIFRPVMPSWT